MSDESRLLKEILVGENRGAAYSVARLARISYRTVIDQTDGKVNPSVHVLKAAYLVTGDPRLKTLLEPDGYILTPTRPATSTKSVECEALDVHAKVSQLHMIWQDAKADGRIDRREKNNVLRVLNEMKQELAELEAAVSRETE